MNIASDFITKKQLEVTLQSFETNLESIISNKIDQTERNLSALIENQDDKISAVAEEVLLVYEKLDKLFKN